MYCLLLPCGFKYQVYSYKANSRVKITLFLFLAEVSQLGWSELHNTNTSQNKDHCLSFVFINCYLMLILQHTINLANLWIPSMLHFCFLKLWNKTELMIEVMEIKGKACREFDKKLKSPYLWFPDFGFSRTFLRFKLINS